MSKKTLIIGAGGVGNVVAFKCAMNSDTFGEITLASRTKRKCDDITANVKAKTGVEIRTAKVDADSIPELKELIAATGASIVINVALPYQDLTIMDACEEMQVDYLDTANYEHPDTAKFEYKEQWARDEEFRKANIMGLLGSGFDPGVTNVFCAVAIGIRMNFWLMVPIKSFGCSSLIRIPCKNVPSKKSCKTIPA